MFRASVIAAVTGVFVLAASGPATTQEDFYSGKTIKMIINIGAGGATGIQAQLFAKHWEKYMPGKPNIVVQEVVGGANLKGIQQVARGSQPDGLTVGWLVGVGGINLLGPEALRVPATQFSNAIIAGIGTNVVAYARKSAGSGLEKASDIVKAGRVKLGGLRATSTNDLAGRLSLDVLGVEHDYVLGYKSGAEMNAALLRGEIDVVVTPADSYLSRISATTIKEGQAIPLWYFAAEDANGKPIPHAALEAAGVRPFQDVYQEIKGAAPSGTPWRALQWIGGWQTKTIWFVTAVPGTPADRLAALRDSFWKTVDDPEYQAAAIATAGALPTFNRPQDTIDSVAKAEKVDDELGQFLSKFIGEGQR
jgi:tripartite-type tricarboxylate transporter receptor subunit TctC